MKIEGIWFADEPDNRAYAQGEGMSKETVGFSRATHMKNSSNAFFET